MSVLSNSAVIGLLGAPGAAGGGYEIERSVRFNSSDSAYLSRTPSSAGNRKTFTHSFWVKRSAIGSQKAIFTGNTASNFNTGYQVNFDNGDTLSIGGTSPSFTLTTSQVFRDPSAWYHIVVSIDTTQSTASNRVKLYVNGVQVEDFGTSNYPSQNADLNWNGAFSHRISGLGYTSSVDFDGYLADVHFIDGQALDPSSFTETDATTGQLVPIEYANPYTVGTVQFAYNASSTAMDSASTSLTLDVTGYSYSTWTGSVVSSNAGGGNSVKVLRSTSGDPVVWAVSTTEATPYLWLSQDGINWTSPGTKYTTNGINVYLTAPYLGFAGGTNPNVWTIGSDVDGPNTFHLPFSDNSSAAALGTDTSGAGNDWDVYNISTVDISRNYTNFSCSSTGNVSAININSVSQTVNVANLNTLLESSQFHDRAKDGYSFTLPGTSGSTVTLNYSNMNNLSSVKIRLQRVATIDSTVRVEITGAATSDVVATTNSQEFSFATTSSSGTIKLTTQNSSNGVVCQDIFFDPGDTTSDSLVDTPTNGTQTDTGVGGEVRGNYCTWNPLKQTSGTYSDGNLQIATSAGNKHYQATFGLTSGKWYWEVTPTTGSTPGMIGIALDTKALSDNLNGAGAMSYYSVTGNKQGGNTSGVDTSYGSSYTYNDVIGVALDLDSATKTLTFYKNGVSQGVAFNPDLTLGSWHPAVSAGSSSNTTTFVANFGQRPFAHPVSGYKALCTANLDDPLVAQPSTVMDVALYTGTSASQTISGLGFSPDLVWIKTRSTSGNHAIFDTIRGPNKVVYPSLTNAEDTYSATLTSFDSSGFSLGYDDWTGVNFSGRTYVAWTWDSGSSTVSNTDGSITSQVRANASAGFSIVTYTGNGTDGATIGHGLGVTPGMVIVKRRDGTGSWPVAHSAITISTQSLGLNFKTNAVPFGDGWINAWSSTTFTANQGAASIVNVNANTGTYVAYCFAPVDGYSSFGSYTGNGSTDGPFVYTGFRPKLVIIKYSSASGTDWLIYDSERGIYNVIGATLYPNDSYAENDVDALDFTSNGFKIRASTARINTSTGTYIYAAFAESPFKTARAR